MSIELTSPPSVNMESSDVVNYSAVLDLLGASEGVRRPERTATEMQCSGHCLVAVCPAATVATFLSQHMSETQKTLL
eukprot:gene13854-16371_t